MSTLNASRADVEYVLEKYQKGLEAKKDCVNFYANSNNGELHIAAKTISADVKRDEIVIFAIERLLEQLRGDE